MCPPPSPTSHSVGPSVPEVVTPPTSRHTTTARYVRTHPSRPHTPSHSPHTRTQRPTLGGSPTFAHKTVERLRGTHPRCKTNVNPRTLIRPGTPPARPSRTLPRPSRGTQSSGLDRKGGRESPRSRTSDVGSGVSEGAPGGRKREEGPAAEGRMRGRCDWSRDGRSPETCTVDVPRALGVDTPRVTRERRRSRGSVKEFHRGYGWLDLATGEERSVGRERADTGREGGLKTTSFRR